MSSLDTWDFDGWSSLIRDVGTWSELNFGHSDVPVTPMVYDDGEDLVPVNLLDLSVMVPSRAEGRYTGPTASLGALAPILGLVEEIGEFSRARTQDDTLDAVGDVVIYMSDAMHRMRFSPGELMTFLDIAEGIEWPGWATVGSRLSQAVGRVCHVVLKRAQRIRDMHIETKYRTDLVYAFAELASAVNHAAETHSKDENDRNPAPAWTVGREVFDGIVAKRNWRK